MQIGDTGVAAAYALPGRMDLRRMVPIGSAKANKMAGTAMKQEKI